MFDAFIQQLAATPAPPDSVNQFDDSSPHNAIRQHNLRRYLTQMAAQKPHVLLVAEAPGYKGMRLTGVPFSSRKFIQEGIDGVPVFGTQNGYQSPPDDDNPAWSEQTATIVWGVLRDVRPLPVSWNTYPFHPHQPGKPLSNRKPRQPEIELGEGFLRQIMTLFDFQTVVAIGNTADDKLTQLGIDHHKVRHPAQGGKNDFVAGMRAIFGLTGLD